MENIRMKIANKTKKNPLKPVIEAKKCKESSRFNTSKSTRHVELGLMINDHDSHTLKHARLSTGGGTRNITASKDCSMLHLFKIAVDLFFPDGTSIRGDATSFDLKLLDYSLQPCVDDSTVAELYEKSKVKMLRFYLSAKEKLDTCDAEKKDKSPCFGASH